MMSSIDLQFPDAASLLLAAENAVAHANVQIEYCANSIDKFREGVRHCATETIDMSLASPSENNIKPAMDHVVDFESTLLGFSETMNRILSAMNLSWMDVDQSLGFYLISKGREESTEPSEIRDLTKVMSDSRNKIPGTVEVISNLLRVINGIACGFPEIEDASTKAVRTLERINGELDLADAVLKRQTILAGRLLKSRPR